MRVFLLVTIFYLCANSRRLQRFADPAVQHRSPGLHRLRNAFQHIKHLGLATNNETTWAVNEQYYDKLVIGFMIALQVIRKFSTNANHS